MAEAADLCGGAAALARVRILFFYLFFLKKKLKKIALFGLLNGL